MEESNITKMLSAQQPENYLMKTNTEITLAIMAKLAETISLRAGQASPGYLKLMSQRLSRENPEYVMKALTVLEERKREDGESMLLDLASILAEIRILTPRKKTYCELEAEEMFEDIRKFRESVQ